MNPDDFPYGQAETTHGQLSVDVSATEWIPALTHARDELGCDFFDFLSAVDELDDGIRIVAHVYSTASREHLLIRTLLPPGSSLPTATTVYRGANWHERETAEMFGVSFDGH